MPVQTEDGGADWLLDVLAHPPEEVLEGGWGGGNMNQSDQKLCGKCEKGRWAGSTGSQRPSPVVLRLKVADRDETGAAANCKLVLQRRPLDKGGSSVDPEDDQCGLPYPVLLGPYVGVTVCSTRHDTVAFRSPVDAYGRMRDDVLTSRYKSHPSRSQNPNAQSLVGSHIPPQV